MPARNLRFRVLSALLCISGFGAQFSSAAQKNPTTWWPDPATGLMWAGQMSLGENKLGMDWNGANNYCAALQLGGYSGWRLPALDEMKAVTQTRHIVPKDTFWNPSANNPPFDSLEFKGGIAYQGGFWGSGFQAVWTSTHSTDNKAWIVRLGRIDPNNAWVGPNYEPTALTQWRTPNAILVAICTRPMEPGLLQLAKEAQASRPVADMLMLKAYLPFNKARIAYQAGQYQESIAQAKNALLIKPDFAPAYWAIGISYGRMDQWDLSITNLQTALKIDKDSGDAKDALQWAKEAQKAAKSGGSPRAQAPAWN